MNTLHCYVYACLSNFDQKVLEHLKLMICNKCRGLLSEWVLLLHNNVHPLTVAAVVVTVRHL